MLTSDAFRASQSSISSNSRASFRPTWRVKRRSASGSVAHGLSRRASANTPICAHSFHENARGRSATACLSSEICIFDTEEGERFQEFSTETFRWIVGDRPSGRLEQLARRRIECAEVLLMLARALIRDRVELEMNLIDTARKPEREEGAVVP